MHPFLKWSLTAAGAAVALSAAVPALVWLRSEAVIERRYPLPSTTAEASIEAKSVARGAHLIAIAGCSDCHGYDLEGRPLQSAGVLPISSSNLRLLAHSMTDEEFERAIRAGITPDSTSTWAMPSMDYTYLSEADIAAIISYLHTLKPLGSPAPDTAFGIPARFAIANEDIVPVAARVSESPSSLDLGPRYDGGHYLSRLACADCHGTDLTGSADAPDLTIVGRYSRNDFFVLLRAGRAPDGRRPKDMSRPRFHSLYDYEIDALYDYLAARARVLARAQTPSVRMSAHP